MGGGKRCVLRNGKGDEGGWHKSGVLEKEWVWGEGVKVVFKK